VAGELALSRKGGGLSLDSAQLAADLTQLQSTDANAVRGTAVRDRFVGRNFLETATFPKATFVANPGALPASTAPSEVQVALTGKFTLHGVTRDVSVPLKVVQNGDRLEVAGSFPVHLADYRIEVPKVPFTTSAPDATVELHLFLKRAA
jgi:polyisoprenoid-binding protein YceI